MAKSGGGKSSNNLLRLSGIIFGIAGVFHALRYLTKGELNVVKFELTYLGSLFAGILLLLLSWACFQTSKR